MGDLSITVIISTYNSVEWLSKVLEGYRHQSYGSFEVIVADDGSNDETTKLIETVQQKYPVKLRHLWHEDFGYRRQKILNTAITKSNYDYILFTDGDCIPRFDFLEVHAQHAEKGYFLSGGYCKLSMQLSHEIDINAISSGNCFDISWLKEKAKIGTKQTIKICSKKTIARFLDFVTPTKATFNNCNSSSWKEDLISVNGYDERMQYGGPDRELGERLVNYGLRSKQIRHQAICLHLDHPRGYKTSVSVEKNNRIRKMVKSQKKIWTEFGISKGKKSE